ncbi:hypothetical protein BU16DRAFT_617135 [Lophium mytilinum]|uniref:Uncharacterized protein n=1 Tax=Lophium mytilinum TaxID=390894 RepID=A0A6A6QXC6_9PEZI|nr:hypothetical protein BU16DRAFT_617135 [Lophium mytilinum]
MASKRKASYIENELWIEQPRDPSPKKARVARIEVPAASRALCELPLNVFGGPHGTQQSRLYTNNHSNTANVFPASNNQPSTIAVKGSRKLAKTGKRDGRTGQGSNTINGQTTSNNLLAQGLGSSGLSRGGVHSIDVPSQFAPENSFGPPATTGPLGFNPAPFPENKVILDNFPAFERHFGDSITAHQWRQSKTRAPFVNPNDDPTIPIIKTDLLLWVEMLYKMIVNQDEIRDHLNSEKYKTYVRLAKTTSANIEVACHNLIIETLMLCENGFQLADSRLDLAKPGDWSTTSPGEFENMGDQDLQCFMRMIKICYALKHEKTICAEVLSGCFGDRWVRQFVNAPIEWRRRKGSNRRNNDAKPERAVRLAEDNLKRAAKEAEACTAPELERPASNDASGQTSAAKTVSTKAEKQTEPSMTAVLQEAYALGITIPDLYLGLLVEDQEAYQQDASQHPLAAAPAPATSLSDPIAQLPAAYLPKIGCFAAPESREEMARRYRRSQSTPNAPQNTLKVSKQNNGPKLAKRGSVEPNIQAVPGTSHASGNLYTSFASNSYGLASDTVTSEFQSASYSFSQHQAPFLGHHFQQQTAPQDEFQFGSFSNQFQVSAADFGLQQQFELQDEFQSAGSLSNDAQAPILGNSVQLEADQWLQNQLPVEPSQFWDFIFGDDK